MSPEQAVCNVVDRESGNKPGNAFVTGATGFLGSHFLAGVSGAYSRIWALVRGANLAVAQQRLVQRTSSIAASVMAPVEVVLGDIEQEGAGLSDAEVHSLAESGVCDFWHFAATLAYESRNREMILRRNLEGTKHVLELARRLGAKRFVYISTAFVAGKRSGLIPEQLHEITQDGFNNAYEESKCHAEHEVMRQGRLLGMDVRILRPPIVVGPASDFSSGGSDSGYYGFASLLVKWRDMFANAPRPARLRVELDTPVHLTPVDSFIADARHLVDHGFPGGPIYHCTSATEVRARDLPKIFARTLDVREMDFIEASVDQPSVIEKLIERLMSLYGVAARAPKQFERSLPPRAPVTPAMAERFLAVWREEQAARAAPGFRCERVRSFDGTSLETYVAGPAAGARKTIVLINAFGMDVLFLRPLIDQLSRSFRVVTWGSRGLPDMSEPFPEACDVTAHARDLEAILDHYGASDATLVGWCTGAQVALRFAAMAPARATALVSLHGAFSFPASVGVTSFKRHIMYLMPRIAQGHEHARAYHGMLYGAQAEGSAGDDARQDEARAAETMLSSDELLLNMTSAPFKNPEALYRYANLVMHLVREPEHAWTPFVECPVLVLSGERDSIAHPDESRELARRLKRATLRIDEGADHFALYNDPGYGKLIHDFADRARAA